MLRLLLSPSFRSLLRGAEPPPRDARGLSHPSQGGERPGSTGFQSLPLQCEVRQRKATPRERGRPGASFISFLYCSVAPLVTPLAPTQWPCGAADHQHTSLSSEVRGVGWGCSLPSQDPLRLEDRHCLPFDSKKLCTMKRMNEKNFREDGALATGFLQHR